MNSYLFNNVKYLAEQNKERHKNINNKFFREQENRIDSIAGINKNKSDLYDVSSSYRAMPADYSSSSKKYNNYHYSNNNNDNYNYNYSQLSNSKNLSYSVNPSLMDISDQYYKTKKMNHIITIIIIEK